MVMSVLWVVTSAHVLLYIAIKSGGAPGLILEKHSIPVVQALLMRHSKKLLHDCPSTHLTTFIYVAKYMLYKFYCILLPFLTDKQ